MKNLLKTILVVLVSLLTLSFLAPFIVNILSGLYLGSYLRISSYLIQMKDYLLLFYGSATIPLMYVLYKHGKKYFIISILSIFLLFNFIIYDYLPVDNRDDSWLLEIPLIAFVICLTQAFIYRYIKNNYTLKIIFYIFTFNIIEIFIMQAVIPSFKLFKGFP